VKREELEGLAPVFEDLATRSWSSAMNSDGPRDRGAPDRRHERIVYMHVNEPVVLINPVLKLRVRLKMLVWTTA